MGDRDDFVHVLETKGNKIGYLALHHVNSDLTTTLRGISSLSEPRRILIYGLLTILAPKMVENLDFGYSLAAD